MDAAEMMFAPFGLPDTTLADIGRRARLRPLNRLDWCFTKKRRAIVHFLYYGCVREELPDGSVRLWRDMAMFGDWTGESRVPAGSRSMVLTTAGLMLSISRLDLHEIAGQHPGLFLALGNMSARRLHAAETVYGTRRQVRPATRVAALLLHLTEDWRRYQSGGKWRPIDSGVHDYVEGPTQVDIADALGISLSSVENALADLRREGALAKASSGPGRTNRLYRITDPAVLKEVASDK
ncbi:Crp/Fnr family transcriptional regulator [Streptomyces sp. NPDC059582]|uniref:Crp/Fnr family transcriptional regulator n=1 Tax=Streptomyces sp. NPDC059582 TaxID=3346875 RepID=UPI0036CD941B